MDSRKRALTRALGNIPLRAVRNSDAVRKIGFDPKLRMVAVVFTGRDTIYGYPDLGDEEIRGLLEVIEDGKSLGTYVNTVIKPNHDADRVQI